MNRLESCFHAAGSQHEYAGRTDGAAVVSFFYDHLGNRVAALETGADDSAAADGYEIYSPAEAVFGGYFYWKSREYDSEPSLQCGRTRSFDPTVGRWLAANPLGCMTADDNLYPYSSPATDSPPNDVTQQEN